MTSQTPAGGAFLGTVWSFFVVYAAWVLVITVLIFVVIGIYARARRERQNNLSKEKTSNQLSPRDF